jgi:hypothetical protein
VPPLAFMRRQGCAGVLWFFIPLTSLHEDEIVLTRGARWMSRPADDVYGDGHGALRASASGWSGATDG